MNNKHILVFGDAMIDKYIEGSVSRISPEAPVPVLNIKNEKKKLGGACNVAENIAALGCCVAGVFIVGQDIAGNEICRLLKERSILDSFVLQPNDTETIRKVRIVAAGQQIARLDYSDHYVCNDEITASLIAQFARGINWADIVIISDYDKGTCSDKLCRLLIGKCKSANIPVIVDPKGRNWNKYKGADIITPNMKEINTYVGMEIDNSDSSVEKAFANLHKTLGVANLLITRSEQGMSLINDEGVKHMPAEGKEVFDVSGAGDTVVATLATVLDKNLGNLNQAVKVANIAAGIVIAKRGTAVVTMKELQEAISSSTNKRTSRIFSRSNYEEFKLLISQWKKKGDTIATTNGCFDVIHRGHIRLIQGARECADHLIVGINSDASVKRLKGANRPVNNEVDRANVISSIKGVDAVVIFDPEVDQDLLDEDDYTLIDDRLMVTAQEAPMALLKLVTPDVHVKGGDYKCEDVPEAIFAHKFVSIPFEDGYSTTKTIHEIQSTIK